MKKECVAIAINEHMMYWLAKTDGENGAFVKANRHPTGGNCFVLTTPSGHKLAGGQGDGGAEEALKGGMPKWRQLSDQERRALPESKKGEVPPQAVRCTPPSGGLILRSFIRNLKKDSEGQLDRITKGDLKNRKLYPDWNPIYTEPAHYHVWLTEAEWKSLVPSKPKIGDRLPVPEGIRMRIFRYHLLNGTFGLPLPWDRKEVRAGKLTLTVEAVEPVLRLQLEGSALLTTDVDPTRAARGYDVKLLGQLAYSPEKKAFTQFDIVALGDYWGGDYEGGRFKQPGCAPLGIAFELVSSSDSAVDRTPPLVHMDRKEDYDHYFAAESP